MLMIAVAVLTSDAILQRIEYQRLWDKYQLMAGREIVAMSPQPVGVDQVPGAAELTQQEQQSIGTAQATQPVETSVAQEENPLSTEAVVRFDNFTLRSIEGANQWELSVDPSHNDNCQRAASISADGRLVHDKTAETDQTRISTSGRLPYARGAVPGIRHSGQSAA